MSVDLLGGRHRKSAQSGAILPDRRRRNPSKPITRRLESSQVTEVIQNTTSTRYWFKQTVKVEKVVPVSEIIRSRWQPIFPNGRASATSAGINEWTKSRSESFKSSSVMFWAKPSLSALECIEDGRGFFKLKSAKSHSHSYVTSFFRSTCSMMRANIHELPHLKLRYAGSTMISPS